MGDPLQHARSSAEKFGGVAADYLEIHQIMDSTKLFLADWRHRAIMHNTFGIYLMETWIVGSTFLRESDGEEVCTRTVVTQHIMEDLNMVPTLGEFLREMPLRRWMMRATPTEVRRMKGLGFSDELQGEEIIDHITAVPTVGPVHATISWHSGETDPEQHGWYLVDHVCAAASEARGCPALYFEAGKWYIDADDRIEQPQPTWWAKMAIDPILDDLPKAHQNAAVTQTVENVS